MAHHNPNSSKGHWRAPDGNEYIVVDMPHQMLYHIAKPTEEDRACAKPRNPNECAYAQSHMRTEGVTTAQFGTDKVYLPKKVTAELRRRIPALKGVRTGTIVALRGKIGVEAKQAIDLFDGSNGEIFPDEGIFVGGIPPSEGINSMRAQQKRTRERWSTKGNPDAKPRRKIHLRNASRRAQIFHEDEAA